MANEFRKGTRENPFSEKEIKEKQERIKEIERQQAIEAGKDIVLLQPGTRTVKGNVRGGRVEKRVKELQKNFGKDTKLKIERSIPKLKETLKKTGVWQGSLAEYTKAFPSTRVAKQQVQIKKGESAKSILTKLRQKSKIYDKLYVTAPKPEIKKIKNYRGDSSLARNISFIPRDTREEPQSYKISQGFFLDELEREKPVIKAGRDLKVKKREIQIPKLQVPEPSAKTIKQKSIQRTFTSPELTKYLDKIPDRKTKILTEKLKTEKNPKKRAKLYFNIGIQRYKKEGVLGLLDQGDKIWIKDFKLDQRLNFINDTYNKVRKNNQKDAIRFLQTESNKKTINKATELFILGQKAQGEKITKLAKLIKEKPFTLVSKYVGLSVASAFGPTLIKKGLEGGHVVSGFTKIASTAIGANYVYDTIKGHNKAQDKQQYIINKSAELLAYRLAFKKLSVKETANIKKALAQLSPFYKGKIKIDAGFPQTKPSKIAKTQAQTKNFYHVTTSKVQDLIKKDVLKVLSKKTGLGKDRIRFREDFLFVSDKGLVSYGIKGTKVYQKNIVGEELSKILKGKFKKFKTSGILKKIESNKITKKKGKLKLRTFEDNYIIEFSKNNKLIIGGQRAANIQLPKKHGRKTLDWDLITNKNKQMAEKFVESLNKYYGKKRFKTTKTLNSYQVYDTKIKDHIVDFVKPSATPGKLKAIKIGDNRFVSIKTLTNNKIAALSKNKFQKRWEKDFIDLKNQLKGTKQFKKYKGLIKEYEKSVLKGEFDSSQAKYTISNLKQMGFSPKAIKYLTMAKRNPLKFTALKILTRLNIETKPDKFNIIEFKDIKVGSFPKKINTKIQQAASGLLSQTQKEKLRIELVDYVKKNPGRIFPGTKTLSNIAKPFGLEEEWVTSPGSKFYTNPNIRSKFYKLFGIKKGEGIIYDDQIGKIIQVFEVTGKKQSKKSKIELSEFLKLLKEKYKNPKKLIKEIIAGQDIKITVDKNGNIREIRDIPRLKRKLGIMTSKERITPKKLQTKRTIDTQRKTETRRTIKQRRKFDIRSIKEDRLRKKIKQRRKFDIRSIKEARPKRLINLRKKPIPRRQIDVPIRDQPRPEPRPTPRRPKPVPPKPPPPRPRRRIPDFPRPQISTTPPPLPKKLEIEIKKIIEKLKKKKKKKIKIKYQYTPTLSGLGTVAGRTKGVFGGFEVRGNIIKLKPVKVIRHKRKNLKTKTYVKRYRRRKPRK